MRHLEKSTTTGVFFIALLCEAVGFLRGVKERISCIHISLHLRLYTLAVVIDRHDADALRRRCLLANKAADVPVIALRHNGLHRRNPCRHDHFLLRVD